MSETITILKALRRLGEVHVVTDDADFRAPGVKPHSYEVWAFPRWMLADIDVALAAYDPALDELTREDYEEVLTDHRRLARELDVALNGEEGAAEQASLCDLIGDAQKMREQLAYAVKARDDLARHGLLTQIKLDSALVENRDLHARVKAAECVMGMKS